MSIETLLADLTAAIRENTAVLKAGGAADAPKATRTRKSTDQPTASGATEGQKVLPPAQPAETQQTPTQSQTAEQPKPATPDPETMKAIAAEGTKLASAQGREGLVAAIKKFLPNVTEEKELRIPNVVAAGKATEFLAYLKSVNNSAGIADIM